MNYHYACLRALLKFRILLLFVTVLSSTAFAGIDDGGKLFKKKCAVCHKLDKTMLTGPGLEGIASRAPSDKWLFDWIKDNKALIKSGDAYANKVHNEIKGDMTVFASELSDDQINDIILYIKNPPVAVTPAATAPKDGGSTTEQPGSSLNWTLILLGILFFLAVLIAVLRGVRIQLQKVVNEKESVEGAEDLGFWGETCKWMNANKTVVAVVILILVGWGADWAWYSMKDIGVYTNYKPEQPIKFSHKIHAGDNAINCQYCHFSAEKSRHAGLPTATICMNCHKGIDKGPETGTTEIAKIYTAAGFDPAKGTYSLPQQPISWIKVHNLPDFVFFSHQQHVKVGKLDCANCHGEVKDMTVAQQVKPLTMGWCIDCHRTTEVAGMKMNADSSMANPYYEDMHKKLAAKYKGTKEKLTVDKIGGIECAKCHY